MTAVTRGARAPCDHNESLESAMQQTLDEARMVLPGIQAVFGFQLIAIFSDAFSRIAGPIRPDFFISFVWRLIVGTIALIMTPAAYDRRVEPRAVTPDFLALASWFISAALLPLAAGLALDVHLVARVITGVPLAGGAIGAALFAMLMGLWFAYPQWHAARRRRGAKR